MRVLFKVMLSFGIRHALWDSTIFLVYIICFKRILKARSENSQKLGKGLFNYGLSSRIPKKHFYRLENISNVPFFLPPLFQTIMDKSLGTLLLFWGIFQFTQVQPLPSPHKQCWTHVLRIFTEFQLCIGWGEGELQENFEKKHTLLRGNREMTEQYEYCSTVPRMFVQYCRFT